MKYFTQSTIHLLDDCVKALEGLALDEVVAFVPSFLSRLNVTAYVYGNIDESVRQVMHLGIIYV